jgi:protein-disulfide isomerase-like protein with CxxC motif
MLLASAASLALVADNDTGVRLSQATINELGRTYGEPARRRLATWQRLLTDLADADETTKLPADTRRYIQQADARIANTSGQPFGEAYLSGLLLDPTMILDSLPPISAILATQSLDATKNLRKLRAIQRAH